MDTPPRSSLLLASLLLFLAVTPLPAQESEPIDWEMVGRIRDEGFDRSQVMSTLAHLTDQIGPRLTGSPQMAEANQWTLDQLEAWGLRNGSVEPWGEFGRGWSFDRVSMHLLEPQKTTLFALPEAWTPGTDGPVEGPVERVSLETEADLDRHRGQLGGKILLVGDLRDPRLEEEPALSREGPDRLTEIAAFEIRSDRRRSGFRDRFRRILAFRRQLNEYLVDEGVLATVEMSGRDGGILRVGAGGSREPGESVGVPSVVLSAEQYRWLARMLDSGRAVRVELDVSTRFHDDDLTGYNTVAEIPGRGEHSDELVMVGAHLDSWHGSPGSNDNAAGVAVAMEAVRILSALGIQPARTIRIALWSGEEQGLLGSRAYVRKHFAERPAPSDPETSSLPRSLWPETWPIEYKPAWDGLSAYFNLDNGSGRIRGVYTQGNLGVRPIFERWLQPFHDLAAETVSNRDTGGTDHLAFDAVGLPGFQFIQDPLDYSTRTHHTNLDHYDHASAADLKQASVIMASFLYHAAMRPELLPRKERPRPPATDSE